MQKISKIKKKIASLCSPKMWKYVIFLKNGKCDIFTDIHIFFLSLVVSIMNICWLVQLVDDRSRIFAEIPNRTEFFASSNKSEILLSHKKSIGNSRIFGHWRLLTSILTHYSKSQNFVQKFNFDKPPTFSRVFHPNFLDNFSREIKVVNS